MNTAAPRVFAAALCAAASLSAAADSEFYGKVNLSLERYEEIDAAGEVQVERPSSSTPGESVFADLPAARVAVDNWQMNTNASRLGFKGSKALGNGAEAIFKLEYEVAVDDGDFGADALKARNVYTGFKGDWGQLIVGRNDTPYKLLGKPVDVFNDYHNGDIKAFLNGEDRRNNMLCYRSPGWGGFRFAAAVSPGEGDGVDDDDSGLADYIGLSVEYKRDGLFAVGLALNDGMNDAGAPQSGRLSGWRLTLRLLDWRGLSAGLLAQSLEDDDGADFFEETATVLSFAYALDGWKLKLQLGSSEGEAARPEPEKSERSQTAFGVERKLDKNVKWFAYYSAVERDATALVSGADFEPFSSAVALEDTTFGAGMEYKF